MPSNLTIQADSAAYSRLKTRHPDTHWFSCNVCALGNQQYFQIAEYICCENPKKSEKLSGISLNTRTGIARNVCSFETPVIPNIDNLPMSRAHPRFHPLHKLHIHYKQVVTSCSMSDRAGQTNRVGAFFNWKAALETL